MKTILAIISRWKFHTVRSFSPRSTTTSSWGSRSSRRLRKSPPSIVSAAYLDRRSTRVHATCSAFISLHLSASIQENKSRESRERERERDGSRRDVDGISRGGMLLARGAPVGGLRSLCSRLLRSLPLLRQPQAPLPPTTHPPAQEAPCLRPSFLPTFSPSPWRRPPPPTFRFRFSPLIPLRLRPPALWVIFLLLTIPGRQPLVDAPACRFYAFRPLPLLPRLRWTRFPPRADG